MARRVLLLALVVLLAVATAGGAHAQSCTALDGRKGQCMNAASCRTTTVANRCPGSATFKCCLDATAAPTPTPTPTTPSAPTPCTDLLGTPGTCLLPSQCTTSTVSNRCPGAFKCCLQPTPLPTNPFDARGTTMTFTLRTQAFPNSGYPGAVVYVPRNYDAARPLNIALFVHGFWNCITNVIRSVGDGVRCSPNAPARRAYGLIDQVEAAAKNVLLVVAETARDINSGNPGRLGQTNGLRDFLNELLGESLAPVFGARTVSDINRLIVLGHSAAYQSTAAFARGGGVPALREIHLLDSLYGGMAHFQHWIAAHKSQFGGGAYKFSNIYYTSTHTNSVAQAKAIRALVPASVYAWDATSATPAQALFDTPVLFKATAVKDHDGIPAAYVVNLLRASPI